MASIESTVPVNSGDWNYEIEKPWVRGCLELRVFFVNEREPAVKASTKKMSHDNY